MECEQNQGATLAAVCSFEDALESKNLALQILAMFQGQ